MTDTPSWLAPPLQDDTTHHPEQHPAPAVTVTTAELEQVKKSLLLTQYEAMFMRVIDEMAGGKTLSDILRNDFRGFEMGAFLKWIKKDPARHALYKEAKEIRTETWADESLKHAKGEYELEDVQRSRLVVEQYRWLMGADHSKQYGPEKGLPTMGGGGITVNITGVTSPYARPELETVEQVTIDG